MIGAMAQCDQYSVMFMNLLDVELSLWCPIDSDIGIGRLRRVGVLWWHEESHIDSILSVSVDYRHCHINLLLCNYGNH